LSHACQPVLVAGGQGQILAVMENRNAHDHAILVSKLDGMASGLRGKMEYVNLCNISARSRKMDVAMLTASDARAFGTATKISAGSAAVLASWAQYENGQKFMVLTCSMKRSHGFGRDSGDASRGSALLNEGSFSSPSFHTMSLLSLPCLHIYSAPLHWLKMDRVFTHVMILSCPQPAMPRIALSWACQTARGLITARSQTTTKPSASPVKRRSLRRTNVAAWTCVLCPRKMHFGCAGRSSVAMVEADVS
jgi:hypothetical protein